MTARQHNTVIPPTRMDVDGGYLIKDVTIIAEGTWNGLTYSAAQLAKAAGSWRDNTVWDRHFDGMARDESNRIGLIKNQRYQDKAIICDILLSNETENGMDMIYYVRTDQINGISVEHVNTDTPSGDQMFATDISFLGAAVVPTPACTVCQLSKEELRLKQEDFDKLQGTVAELAKGVAELTKVDVKNIVKEQTEKDAKTIVELSARIKKLENMPVPGTQTASDIVDGYADLIVEHGKTYRSGE